MSLPLFWLGGCTNLAGLTAEKPHGEVANVASPTVVAASFGKLGIDVEFDQAMVTDATAAAVRLYKLRDHADLDNVPNRADHVAVDSTWLDAQHLHVDALFVAGSYVLQITSGATGVSGRALDGLSGRGAIAGIHRPDDDFLDGPSNYQSTAFHVGSGVPVFSAPPAFAALTISEITALRKPDLSGALTLSSFTLWRFGQPRVGAYPLHNRNGGLRLSFYSRAGGRYGLPTPADLPRYVQLFNKQNSRLGQVVAGLGNRNDTEDHFPAGYAVAGAFGNLVTLTAGPLRALDEIRGAGDRLWLFLGENAGPRTVSAEVLSWNLATTTFTLSGSAMPVSAAIFGNTATTDRLWYDGELRGGYALRLSGGVDLPIDDATGTTVYLATTTTTTDCGSCSVVFVDAAARLQAGDTALISSHTWYVHFGAEPPVAEPQFFSLNSSSLLRSLGATLFRDGERDGDETIAAPTSDDEFVLQLAFYDDTQPQPPFSRLNDGFAYLYETAFAAAGLDCLADGGAACAVAIADNDCPSHVVPGEVYFSLYTADGAAGEFGTSDTVNPGEFSPQYVQLFASGAKEPLPAQINTRVIVNTSSAGSFATTLISLRSLQKDQGLCDAAAPGLRGFRDGDVLKISHLMRTVAVSEPRTLDGNGDGVAEADVADDWVGIWRDAAQTFVPLVRYPRRIASKNANE